MQRISFITNVAKNTLEYVKLLLHSLEHNLDGDEHEILIFIDSDNENCLEYLLEAKSRFKDLRIIKNNLNVPVGYSRNSNILTEYAKYDIVSYLQSDMVVGPHYDTEILQHVKPGRILSATRVEPPLHGHSQVTVTENLGLTPEEFNFENWNKFSNSVKRDELINFFFAPITYYKQDWLRIGGYDTAFRRGREDSDFVQRCLHAGIELVQTFSANVYHFTCVSSRGKNWYKGDDAEAQQNLKVQQTADKIELARFIRKWGNFNHGEQKLHKLDIDLVLHNYNIHHAVQLEPFFSRVWLSSEEDKKSALDIYKNNVKFANHMMGYSDEDWEKYAHLFRREDFNLVFNVGTPTSYSIVVLIDFSKIKGQNVFLQNIQNLYDILSQYEAGQYDLDHVFISIKEIKKIDSNTTAVNPEFDYTLLTVY